MEKEIIKLYKEGNSIMAIHKKTGMSRPKISKLLKDNKIKINNSINKKDILKAWDIYRENNSLAKTALEVGISKTTLRVKFKELGLRDYDRDSSYDNKIIELYNQNKTIREISNLLNINNDKVVYCLRYHNLNRPRTCRYAFDKDIFKKIDTEAKAYWLGFLYADGCIRDNKGLDLCLAAKDRDHLEKFKSFMKSDKEITFREKVNAYRFCIESQELARDLTKLGCFQNKSLTLKFPTKKQVPSHLIHHFMRGYFDGDGCIHFAKDNSLRLSVVGSNIFLNEYEKYILRLLDRDKSNKRSYLGKAEELHYGGNKQVKKIYEFLYKDATIYLERKFEIFKLPLQDKADNNPVMISEELSEDHAKS